MQPHMSERLYSGNSIETVLLMHWARNSGAVCSDLNQWRDVLHTNELIEPIFAAGILRKNGTLAFTIKGNANTQS